MAGRPACRARRGGRSARAGISSRRRIAVYSCAVLTGGRRARTRGGLWSGGEW